MKLSSLLSEEWQSYLSSKIEDIDQIGVELTRRADNGEEILPNRSLVFRSLELPLSEINVVIVGQDRFFQIDL